MEPSTEQAAALPADGAAPPPDDLAVLVRAVEHSANSHPSGCVALGPEAVAAARAAGDTVAEMKVWYFLGFAHHLLSHDNEALEAMERAQRLADAAGDRHWDARIKGGLGAVHSGFGDNASAIELLEQSLEIRRELDDTWGIAASLNNLGVTYEEMGLFPDRARELLTEACTIFAELGDDHGQCAALSHLASLDTTASEALLDEDPVAAATTAEYALRTAERAVEHGRALGHNHRLLAETLIKKARAQLACGRHDEAEAALDEAHGLRHLVDTTHFQLRLASTRGRLHRLRGDLDAAAQEISHGLSVSDGVLRAFERVELLAELVAVHEERGSHADALAAHRALLEATLRQREDAAERRARVMNARLDVERSRVAAEVERLRSERLEVANRELAYAATHDALTGLLNRRGFDAALAARVADPDTEVTCLLGDLDNFKAINDDHSHAVGDQVLREVARLVGAAVRGTDQVARIGGEEIAVLLSPQDRATEVDAVCERVRAAVAGHPWDEVAPGVQVTISIGAASRRPGESGEALMARADALLYAAKVAGRDTVRTDEAAPTDRARLAGTD